MTSRLLRCLALVPMAALHLYCHAAATSAPLLSDYTHSAWGALQGAPVDVLKFAQGKDGWLWIATATGLFRYDGARFERTGSVYGHPLPSSNVLGLAVTGDGAVWVGYRLGGVSVFRKGGTRTYTEADGLPAGAVFHIEAAPDGAMWVGTRDGAARLAPGADRFEPMGANVNLPTRRVYQILFARDGTQWMGTMYGAYFRRPGESRFSHAWPRTMLTSMDEGPDGSIWAVDTEANYYRVRTSEPAPGESIKPEEKGISMRFGRDGGMWLLQPDGVERKLQPSGPSVPAQRLTQQNGISGPLPQSTFQDREGNLWIGTSTGLDRLRPNRLKILQVEGQFDHPGLLPGPDGDVWIGDYVGDVRSFTAEGMKKVELKAMLSASHWAPDGVLWLGNEKGLHRRAPDGSMTQLAPPDGVAGLDPQALQQDRSGALWASFSGGGLFKRVGGQWIREGGLRGFPKELTTAMAMDGQGTLWFGHARNSISLVAERQQDGAVRRLGAEQGLELGTVLQLYRDGELMWAGGEDGVALYRAGRFAALRGERGETFRGVSGIVRLPGGDLWLHGADGLYHVDAASVAAWLNQPDQAVRFERFDALDGLQGHAAQLRPVPSLIRGPDGLLWLATSGAIATLDPAHIRRNPLPPPVQVHTLVADGVRYATDGAGSAPVRLPQGSKSLQIAFTALSLSMPERVRFRYRLAGVDDGWQEPVGRREAYYTNLAPGNYRFEVTAANEDGVWNKDGAALEIHIPPGFLQTPWFKLLLALGAGLLLYGAYVLRIRNLTQRMKERLQERLAERSRIARSLHDTLLQSVQGLIMSFHAHAHLLPQGTRERERLDQTLNLADQLLVEGRDQIMDLRASASPEELGLALEQFGKGLAEHRAHRFEARVSEKCRPLQLRVHDEIYAIAREALFNASRYAEAANIVLELDYAPQALTLRVRDDGRGLDEDVAKAGHRPGHWGLVGMRERAASIGAALRIDSSPGGGTVIEVTVPAKLAY
ncbi:sensor histidine kinase [Pseudoduganella aquatica]|nr:sensor histidine kinase [Pseudoduganella aquatica]